MRILTRAVVSHANFLQILRKTQKYRSVSIKHISKHAYIYPGQKLHQAVSQLLASYANFLSVELKNIYMSSSISIDRISNGDIRIPQAKMHLNQQTLFKFTPYFRRYFALLHR